MPESTIPINNAPTPKSNTIDITRELQILGSDSKFKVADTINKIVQLQNYAETSKDKVRLQNAINLMIKLHIDQKDRPQEPYLNHTSNVPLRLINEYGVTDNDLIISAMLHDSVEDQSQKLAQISDIKNEISDREKGLEYIANNFGIRVSKIVSDLSNPEGAGGVTPEEKNTIYKVHVEEIIKNPDVALIKLSDFSENALRLDEITDTPRRLKLTLKYAPVLQVFINRLKKNDVPLPPDKKETLLSKLSDAKKTMGDFVHSSKTAS